MTIDHLLDALADAGMHLLLDAAGTGLRIRGNQPSPDLVAGIKDHKAEIVIALQDARILASDLAASNEIDSFVAELRASNERGDLPRIDWYAGWLAITLARPDIERRSLTPETDPRSRSPGAASHPSPAPTRTSPTFTRHEREDHHVDSNH